jgi:hypothetical protein
MSRGLKNVSFSIVDGCMRHLRFRDVEVLRQIAYPIRDVNWGTLETEELEAEERSSGAWAYRRTFRTIDGSIEGRLGVEAEESGDEAEFRASLTLRVLSDIRVNRAGFVLLHPIAGVAGTALVIRHPFGPVENAHFPMTISPAQPAIDISGLRHCVAGVDVDIAMEGEVFEMEDQRNWTDASFKTYCRPLSLPRPYLLRAGEVVRQSVSVKAKRSAATVVGRGSAAQGGSVVVPQIELAHEPTLYPEEPWNENLRQLAIAGLQIRIDVTGDLAGIPLPVPDVPVTLEIVLEEGDAAAGVVRAAEACAARGLRPTRVVALTRPYLASHQQEGPWPEGPKPMDLIPLLRQAFPNAQVGGGMLTNFTEFNRCPPDPDLIDFAAFGTTAIVHAADDLSVVETLEALPDVFASARALIGDRPLRLGLVSIGMRSNPYGADVAANPELRRIPMARQDPRQRERFAGAWTVGVAATATMGGITSFAPAMTGGPLGLGSGATLWPLYHVVAALAALGGREVVVGGGPWPRLVSLIGSGRRGVAGIAANLGPESVPFRAPAGRTLLHLSAEIEETAAADPLWIERPANQRAVELEAFDIAVLKEFNA